MCSTPLPDFYGPVRIARSRKSERSAFYDVEAPKKRLKRAE